jgi:hypothetical protein
MDSISIMCNDYEKYKQLCEQHNIEPVSLYADFYTHGHNIVKKYQCAE